MESAIFPFYLHTFFLKKKLFIKFNKMKNIVGQIRWENIQGGRGKDNLKRRPCRCIHALEYWFHGREAPSLGSFIDALGHCAFWKAQIVEENILPRLCVRFHGPRFKNLRIEFNQTLPQNKVVCACATLTKLLYCWKSSSVEVKSSTSSAHPGGTDRRTPSVTPTHSLAEPQRP